MNHHHLTNEPVRRWERIPADVKIYEEPLSAAKIRVDPNFPWITEEARKELDAWLLARFGRKKSVLDGERCLFFKDQGIAFVPPGTLASMQALINTDA